MSSISKTVSLICYAVLKIKKKRKYDNAKDRVYFYTHFNPHEHVQKKQSVFHISFPETVCRCRFQSQSCFEVSLSAASADIVYTAVVGHFLQK
uniref:Conotoxin n=1 Tax=Conus betulinus TaxID=89764 RepID=A0A1P7ZCS8_CONBE|nr:Conotoxin [Conus betulinus]